MSVLVVLNHRIRILHFILRPLQMSLRFEVELKKREKRERGVKEENAKVKGENAHWHDTEKAEARYVTLSGFGFAALCFFFLFSIVAVCSFFVYCLFSSLLFSPVPCHFLLFPSFRAQMMRIISNY